MSRGWAITPRNDYTPEWGAVAKQVKDDAGWCCVRCNHVHGVEGWFILTVHHLDGDKSNNRWWNTIALCQRCHLSIQGRVAPERPFLFAHTPWFVPYVCGFYSSYYGGTEISKSEALADPDKYLRLGQPWLYEEAA